MTLDASLTVVKEEEKVVCIRSENKQRGHRVEEAACSRRMINAPLLRNSAPLGMCLDHEQSNVISKIVDDTTQDLS